MRRDGPDGSLWRVCLHEHAHLALARSFGACGFVRIRRVHAADDEPVRFTGSFQMHGALSEREWRVVALAGTIAEWVAESPDIGEAAIVARLQHDTDALSPLDARLAAGWDAADVRACVQALRGAWRELERDAGERAAAIVR